MLTFTTVATKGGVGKTTLTANLGGLLADLGYRVLLIDADVQPSLTRYFKLAYKAPNGLTAMVMSGSLTTDCISYAEFPPQEFEGDHTSLNVQGGFLHIVCSDTQREDSPLQIWLSNQLDRLVRIRMVLSNPELRAAYDVCIIDTQGAVGHLQDAAVNAADVLLAPVAPDVLSAREFVDGTIKLVNRHEAAANLGYKVPAIQCIINRTENTVDSRTMSQLIRDQFIEMRGRVNVLSTQIPQAVAYKKGATSQVPAHWIDPVKVGDSMHSLLWELIPNLVGTFAPNHRAELSPALAALHVQPQEPEGPSTASESEQQ
ncbi:ParA family protein [Diaphorobacter sp. HDW4B]|uniref:ParA family protein n=1 Tax=Diaphorobacter sp. HDW4B TaxID=2714925 RepID=UPI00140C636B|nr:ParA family protein [Diaphorobacter sp. HDW4B]QIL73102.1 ParA family protein [Diaphorobacter sp. HDW4B]